MRNKKKTYRGKCIELVEEAFSTPTIDRDAGVIRGVKVLGRTSKNKREYTMRALEESAVLCEGIKVYVNHDRSGKERGIGEFFAELKDVRTKEDGNYADLHYLKSHPLAESVLERTDRFAGSFGLSPHQFGPTRNERGIQIVESVQRARSVDIVDTPATTVSLFESEETTMTLKEFVESLPDDTWGIKHLTELIEMDAEMVVPTPDEEAAPDDQVKAAFRAMVLAAFDDDGLDTKATIARIRELLSAQDKLQKEPEHEEDEAPAEEDVMVVESLKAEIAALKTENACRELLESAGLDSDKVKIKALTALDESDRSDLIESWKQPARKNGKPASSRPLHETALNSFPKTHEEFISGIKGR